MNPYQKGAQFLFRLAATGMLLIGGMMIGLELLNHRAHGAEISAVKVALYSLILIAGAVLFIASPRFAARLTGEEDAAEDETPSDS